ncbi:methionine ABC transporter ATP-binding protein [Sciscionella marina]|uniref:methionine ABC transporter ATP-binding protein n=1 Tax=Sciscionella marina TaxID=508770 RepID=UPI0003637378|nr:ATP-binding cassette domain-containing protein [Sciscionella marina]
MITVEHLTKSFSTNGNRVLALDDVNLDVQPGSVYGVLGTSGSGKSTLAKVVAGAERPDRGAVRIDGTDLRTLGGRELRNARRQVGVVPGKDSLLRQRTVAGNIALPLEQAGVDGPNRKRKVGELLDLIGLSERAAHGVDQLTDGQRNRVAIARALATSPGVLIADEPTADTDAQGTAGVLTVLDRARAEYGTSVLLLTDNPGPVRRVADDLAVLRSGRLVAQGSLLAVAADPTGELAEAVLPEITKPRGIARRHDVLAEVVLVGFATVGALLPEAASRFGVTLATVGGGLTRFGDTPIARFLLGVDGENAGHALNWIAEHGGVVRGDIAGGPAALAA